MKYRKKPVVVEAVQFTDTEESILKLSELGLDPVRIDYADTDSPILKIETLEGLMIAAKGDYIIKGVKGEFYPCKPDIFAETYEEAKECRKYDSRRMDSIYCHFGNLCNCAHYDRTDKRKEGKKMKAEFKNGHFNASYGGNVLYEKSTLQRMKKSDLIELIECAQHNYEVLLDERDHFQDMVLSMNKELEEGK